MNSYFTGKQCKSVKRAKAKSQVEKLQVLRQEETTKEVEKRWHLIGRKDLVEGFDED